MGRARVYVSKASVEEALEGRTVTEAAEYLGIGRATLCTRIKEYNLGQGKGNYERTYRRRRKRSEVHRELVKHAGEKLSGDPKRLAEILGLSEKTIRSYLYRGKRASEKFVKEILAKAPKGTMLFNGKDRLPIAAVQKMEVIMDKWGRKTILSCRTKSGETKVFHYKMEDLWKMLA